MTQNIEALREALFDYYVHEHALRAPPGTAEAVIAHRAMADISPTLSALNAALRSTGLCLIDRELLARLHAALEDQASNDGLTLRQALADLLDDTSPS